MKAFDPTGRGAKVGDDAAIQGRTVENANRAADGDDAVVLDEGSGGPQQGFGLEQTVGIHGAEQRVPRVDQADVERIGFAAVGLIDHDHVRVFRGSVGGLDFAGFDLETGDFWDFDQIVGLF